MAALTDVDEGSERGRERETDRQTKRQRQTERDRQTERQDAKISGIAFQSPMLGGTSRY